MRTKLLLWSSAFVSTCGLIASLFLIPDHPLSQAAPSGGEMREAATAFVQSLDDSSRARALFQFEDEERFNWHFIPREREGLPLEEMSLEQRRAAHGLLNAVLSSQGYLKVTSIIRLEEILRELENDPVRRNPERYYFSIFGTPSPEAPWGWRVEGHHLSLNYSSVTDSVAVTPAFMGTNPAEVRSGPYTGLRVLGVEEDLGRELLHSLTDAQRQRAVISAEAPRDVVTTNQRTVMRERYEGLPASEMTADQRDLLIRIVHEYTDNMQHGLAHEQMAKIEEAGVDHLYFAWAGGFELGDPHYYRIHGPTVLFEYDNTQNDANHAHSVWRDLTNDFGEDLLRRHYEQAAPGHGH